MRGELFVVHMIRWNAKARSAVASALGLGMNTGIDTVLDELNPRSLVQVARRLHCQPERVFVQLRNGIGRALGLGPASVAREPKRSYELKVFHDEHFISAVARLLGCEDLRSQVLVQLFDESSLRELMRTSGIVAQGDNVAMEQLFWRLVAPSGHKKLVQYLGFTDIWQVMHTLLTVKARAALESRFPSTQPGEFLLRLIDDALPENSVATTRDVMKKPSDDGAPLDMFAVGILREKFRAFRDVYLTRAKEAANRARASSVGPGVTALVLPLLEYYGLHTYRSALANLILTTCTIGSLCEEVDCDVPKMARPANGTLKSVIGTFEGAPSVSVSLSTHAGIQPIATLVFENADVAAHVAREVPASVESLSREGDALLKNLLGTTIPVPGSMWKQAWKVLAQGPELATYCVLSGQSLPHSSLMTAMFGTPTSASPDGGNVRTHYDSPTELAKRVVDRYRAADRVIEKVAW